MDTLAIVTLAIRIVDGLVRFMGNNQLLKVGEATSIAKSLQEVTRRVEIARRARASVDHALAAVVSDPDNRGR